MKTKVKALLYLDLDVGGMSNDELIDLTKVLSTELKNRTVNMFPESIPGFTVLQISKSEKLLRQTLQDITGKADPTPYELASVRKSQIMAHSGTGQKKWDALARELLKNGFLPIDDYPGHK